MRKQISEPNLRDTLQVFKFDLMANFNCHRVGIIQSVDAAKKTAVVQLVDKRVFFTYESSEPMLQDYSLLLDCPLFINADGNAGFTRPILQGDECLVCFNDRDIDNWYKAGTIGKPRTERMHDLSDGMALVGFHSGISTLGTISLTSTRMWYQDSIIELTDKVKIQNAAENLKTIVDDLIDIITNLKTVDGMSEFPIDSATATDLADLKTRIATFLTT